MIVFIPSIHPGHSATVESVTPSYLPVLSSRDTLLEDPEALICSKVAAYCYHWLAFFTPNMEPIGMTLCSSGG